MEICDLVNHSEEGPRDAMKAIRKRLSVHPKNYTIVMYTLTVRKKHIYRVGESGFNCWGVRRPELVLFLFYVNVSGMHPFVLPAYEDSSSLGFHPHWLVYLPRSTLDDWLPFPCAE